MVVRQGDPISSAQLALGRPRCRPHWRRSGNGADIVLEDGSKEDGQMIDGWKEFI